MSLKAPISIYLSSIADVLRLASNGQGDARELWRKYGMFVGENASPDQVSAIRESLGRLPTKLAVDCGIHSMDFANLGPSMEYYPNHGRYQGGTLVLNENILNDSKVEKDSEGNEINKLDLIFYHELGHGFDEAKAKGEMLCIEPKWLSLSGWSEEPKKGLKRMVIKCPGKPTLRDDWYYDPKAGFPRYYGKRNPWDDWADCFAFYVGNVKGRLPDNKRAYFDDLLGDYYA